MSEDTKTTQPTPPSNSEEPKVETHTKEKEETISEGTVNLDPLANLPAFLKKGTIGFILKPGTSLHPKFVRVLWLSIFAFFLCLLFMYYVPGIARYHVVILFVLAVLLSITLQYVIPALRKVRDEENLELRKRLLLRKKKKLMELKRKKEEEEAAIKKEEEENTINTNPKKKDINNENKEKEE
ncbi:hypothetical protein ABK040_013672 [Willaertia magna]